MTVKWADGTTWSKGTKLVCVDASSARLPTNLKDGATYTVVELRQENISGQWFVTLEELGGEYKVERFRPPEPLAVSEVDELRTAVGANDGEPILDALLRYTFAVQLGCALTLEQVAREIEKATPDAKLTAGALYGGAAQLRAGIPEGTYGDKAQPDAIARWKAEQTQALKDGMVEVVLDQWWDRFMGGLPSDVAKGEFRTLLLGYEPPEHFRAQVVTGHPAYGVTMTGVKSPETISDAMPDDERVRRAREWLADLERQEGSPAEEASHRRAMEAPREPSSDGLNRSPSARRDFEAGLPLGTTGDDDPTQP
jgi:hypothetical protein